MKKILIASLLILSLCVTLTGCFGGAAANQTVEDKLKALGFSEQDLTPQSGDSITDEITGQEEKRAGDFYLTSAASFEDVQKTVYDACGKAAQDGKVLDFMTEEPIEFEPQEAEIVWYAYMREDVFCHVAISLYAPAQGSTNAIYLLQWD